MNEWIPVTERVPEEHIPVLVTERWSKDPFVARYVNGRWVDWYYYDCPEYNNVLAWMELPEAYKGDVDSAMLDELSGEEERIAMEENPG